MESENQQKPKLDDDILQCKADLQKALQAARRVPLDALPFKEKPLQPLNPAQPESESIPSMPKEFVVQESQKSPVEIRIPSFEAIQKEKKESVPIPFNAPLLAQPDNLQLRIEELEQELAETMGRLSAFKQQAEKNAAALTAQVRQLQQAVDEKEMSKKHSETMALEWTQTVDDLKTAQKGAAQILHRRLIEIEALREKLSEAQTQLKQANETNVLLTHEKMELSEAIEQFRLQEQAMSEFESEEKDLESSGEPLLEPYCDPLEEVISEDDTHIEQKLVPDKIPSFNLAEQIMAEQRNAAAARRRPPESNSNSSHHGSIEHVMGYYISMENMSKPPAEAAATPPSAEQKDRFLRWRGERLSEHQESLLSAIIQRDIQRLCGIGSPSVSLRSFEHRPMDN